MSIAFIYYVFKEQEMRITVIVSPIVTSDYGKKLLVKCEI